MKKYKIILLLFILPLISFSQIYLNKSNFFVYKDLSKSNWKVIKEESARGGLLVFVTFQNRTHGGLKEISFYKNTCITEVHQVAFSELRLWLDFLYKEGWLFNQWGTKSNDLTFKKANNYCSISIADNSFTLGFYYKI